MMRHIQTAWLLVIGGWMLLVSGAMAFRVRTDDELSFGAESSLQRERLDLFAELVVFGELVLRLPFIRLRVVLGSYLNTVLLDHLHAQRPNVSVWSAAVETPQIGRSLSRFFYFYEFRLEFAEIFG